MATLTHRVRAVRPGFTVFEVVITTVLLGTLLAVIIPVSKRAIDHQKKTEARRLALIEISNGLERITADRDSWPPLGEEKEMPLEAMIFRQFPRPRLIVQAVEVNTPGSNATRLDAALTWETPQGGRTPPLRLSAFAFNAPTSEGPADGE